PGAAGRGVLGARARQLRRRAAAGHGRRRPRSRDRKPGAPDPGLRRRPGGRSPGAFQEDRGARRREGEDPMSMPGFAMNTPGARARGGNPTAGLIAVVLWLFAALAVEEGARQGNYALFGLAVLLALIGTLTPASLKMANHWERAVVLRLGRLQSISGPGLFVIVPIIDQVVYWLDQRIQTTEFNAEQALSKDTVPVDVNAVVFWQIHDPERAALEITD